MGSKAQVLRGKFKEAAGAIVNNDRLCIKGKADLAIGKARIATNKVTRKVGKVTRTSVNKVK